MPDKLLLLHNIAVPLAANGGKDHDAAAVREAEKTYRKRLAASYGKADFFIFKKSVDARKKNAIRFLYTVAARPASPAALDSDPSPFTVLEQTRPRIPDLSLPHERPVVVGLGPAGLFCALILAKAGLRPLVFERGENVDDRAVSVARYWSTGLVDPESNVQFGEGGAGTFSDGKLMTRISDPFCAYVLETFVSFGAPEAIRYLAKPHVGTDQLKNIVKGVRREIENCGGTVFFRKKLTDIRFDSAGLVTAAVFNGTESVPCTALFLCIGHSARDTFRLLMDRQITVTPKPFSVGVRVEHLQSDIDAALYGAFAGHPALEKASYTLSHRENDRAVYSFCMCPGGVVTASASEPGEIVTNGMSNSLRDGVNANAAIAVSVDPGDHGGSVASGVAFQKRLETAAFNEAGGKAPIQLLGDFIDGTVTHEPHRILPSYTGETALTDLNTLFPAFVTQMLKTGFARFADRLPGFAAKDAVLTAPETRTSSPVRIDRTDAYASVSSPNLYPLGEGAGYAGGITSAAVDGLRGALNYVSALEVSV